MYRPSSGVETADDHYVQQRTTNWYKVHDYSEPCLWVFILYGFISLCYAIVVGLEFWSITAGTMIFIGIIASWRVRVLGLAQSISDSVDDFKTENTRLTDQVDELEKQTGALGEDIYKLARANDEYSINNRKMKATNDEISINILKIRGENLKFKKMVGLLGDTSGNLEDTKNKLFELYDKLASENQRYEANNLMSLFSLVDKDNNGNLNENEVSRLSEYVKLVYKVDIDYSKFDVNNDKTISLSEFISQFRAKLELIKE